MTNSSLASSRKSCYVVLELITENSCIYLVQKQVSEAKWSLKINIYIFKGYFLIFREEKGQRQRGRETSMCGCLLYTPYWGCGLQPRHGPYTGNPIGNPLVHRPAFNPLSHTRQG